MFSQENKIGCPRREHKARKLKRFLVRKRFGEVNERKDKHFVSCENNVQMRCDRRTPAEKQKKKKKEYGGGARGKRRGTMQTDKHSTRQKIVRPLLRRRSRKRTSDASDIYIGLSIGFVRKTSIPLVVSSIVQGISNGRVKQARTILIQRRIVALRAKRFQLFNNAVSQPTLETRGRTIHRRCKESRIHEEFEIY